MVDSSKQFYKRFLHLQRPSSLGEKNLFGWRTYVKKVCFFFFSIWVLFHEHLRITRLQGKVEGIPLTPHYRFHALHRHLDISQAITAQSSPLRIASSRTRTGNFCFPSASR